MVIGSHSLPNPSTMTITGTYNVLSSEVIGGLAITPLSRYRPSGFGYFRPSYLIAVSYEDLVLPEKTAILAALDEATTFWQDMSMDGLGTTIYEPPSVGGHTYPDQAWVMLATEGPVQITLSQGWRDYLGTMTGPILYQITFTLIAGDVEYAYE